MKAAYIYTRKDGKTTHCYGTLREDSNIAITCDDEDFDGITTDNEKTTWNAVCKHLEETYNNKIDELVAV